MELHAKDVESIFNIILTRNSVRLTLAEDFNLRLKRIKMHLRPTNFQIGIDYSLHAGNDTRVG